MSRNRDGHLLAIDLADQAVELRIICPHVGKTYSSDFPACLLQYEGRDLSTDPWENDDCAVAEMVKELGTDALEMARDRTVSPVVLPMPIEWHADDEEFWIAPLPVPLLDGQEAQ